MTTTNLLLTLPTPDFSTGWGGTLNTDFQLIDDVFAAVGTGTSVGINVGAGKTANVGGTLVAGGTVILGSGDNTATVTAPTIRGAAKTGTNALGANLTIDAPNGTGSGGSGSIIFRTAPVATSGTAADTMRTTLEIKPNGTAELLGVDMSPTGSVTAFAGSTAPTGWLLCYGQAVSTTTYAALFAIIGYTYGGSGASFWMPDMRGRAVAGKDNMGGTAANRITAATSGITGTTLGSAGGLEGVTLTLDQIPAHQHLLFSTIIAPSTGSTLTSSNYATRTLDNGSISSNYSICGAGTTATLGLSSSAGLNGGHTNTQPTMILNYIIKT